MANLALANGGYTQIDDYDLSLAQGYNWYRSAPGYAVANIPGLKGNQKIYLHRLIMNPAQGVNIDHINRDPLDNRRCNLRECGQSLNAANSTMKKNNTSGYIGVVWDSSKGLWCARVMVQYRQISLGRFQDIHEAAYVRNQAAIEIFGPDVPLNVL